MMGVLGTGLISVVSIIVSSFVTFFFTRKKYHAEVDVTLVDKMEKSLDFYRHLSDDNRVRLEEVVKRNNELATEVSTLRKQVMDLTMNICMDLTCVNRIREGAYTEKDIQRISRNIKTGCDEDNR